MKSESEVTQSCPTLSDPMDCSPPGSSVHGIFQARVLEWVAIAFSERRTRRCKKKKLVILEGELIPYGLYSKKGQMFRILTKGNGRELKRNKRISSVQKTTKVRNHTFVVVSI